MYLLSCAVLNTYFCCAVRVWQVDHVFIIMCCVKYLLLLRCASMAGRSCTNKLHLLSCAVLKYLLLLRCASMAGRSCIYYHVLC